MALMRTQAWTQSPWPQRCQRRVLQAGLRPQRDPQGVVSTLVPLPGTLEPSPPPLGSAL